MKALTIWQPHATLLASGMRTIETRGWTTSYRGPLMIHAAKKWDSVRARECAAAMDMAFRYGVPDSVSMDGPGAWTFGETLGCVLAVADLEDCIPVPEPTGTVWDAEFGGFGDGRFGWKLANLRPLDEPLPATGKQGLWEPSPGLIECVTKAMARERASV